MTYAVEQFRKDNLEFTPDANIDMLKLKYLLFKPNNLDG
ncbi:hypothetical protein CY0110_20530 [Crocosphaera chwakensis CCY0110]|uniref:Uncharacterized protein n=1 Tax=Crocosphaera chwakensis CCY0110 TaxID=391612 RepID=A3IW23_9CHRO|nr:hypothetical protein CY0110_20530 [Crocosphaera chwakensis CCY0110]